MHLQFCYPSCHRWWREAQAPAPTLGCRRLVTRNAITSYERKRVLRKFVQKLMKCKNLCFFCYEKAKYVGSRPVIIFLVSRGVLHFLRKMSVKYRISHVLRLTHGMWHRALQKCQTLNLQSGCAFT